MLKGKNKINNMFLIRDIQNKMNFGNLNSKFGSLDLKYTIVNDLIKISLVTENKFTKIY